MSDPVGGKGISDSQLKRLAELEMKWPNLTTKMEQERLSLIAKRDFPEEPDLSLTCKTELIDTYLQAVMGRRSVNKDMMIKFTEKGKMVEQDAIDMLSLIDGKPYTKNGERISNDYISGEVDIFEGPVIREANKVIDIKSSWDAESFMMNMLSPLNTAYVSQMKGYLALTGAKEGEVVYCLVNTPESLINDEKRRLFYRMNVATEENIEYKMQADLLEYNMTFDDIDPNMRVMRFKVQADPAYMQKVYIRVEKCRKWLQEAFEIHKKMYLSA